MKLVLTLWTPWEGSKDPQASADDTLRTTLVVMSPLKDVCITNTSSYFLAYLFTLLLMYYPVRSINLFSTIIFKIKLFFLPKELKYWSWQIDHITIFLFYFSVPYLWFLVHLFSSLAGWSCPFYGIGACDRCSLQVCIFWLYSFNILLFMVQTFR